MKNILIGTAAAAAIVGAGAAFAQTPQPMPGMEMRVMKMKGPKTRAEVSSHVQTLFAKLDGNRDGFLTKEEIRARSALKHGAMDGPMKAGEHPGRDKMFERLDSNRDGMISRQEFDAAPPPGMMRHGGMHRGMMMGRMFEKADANKDGRVSLAEAQAAALAHFDRMDLNRDGTVTPDERGKAHEQMKAMHKRG